MISILIWVAIILGIPAAIGVIWWVSYKMKKKPTREPNQSTIPS
jgi:flagellar basal body-associated protein FliL